MSFSVLHCILWKNKHTLIGIQCKMAIIEMSEIRILTSCSPYTDIHSIFDALEGGGGAVFHIPLIILKNITFP